MRHSTRNVRFHMIFFRILATWKHKFKKKIHLHTHTHIQTARDRIDDIIKNMQSVFAQDLRCTSNMSTYRFFLLIVMTTDMECFTKFKIHKL